MVCASLQTPKKRWWLEQNIVCTRPNSPQKKTSNQAKEEKTPEAALWRIFKMCCDTKPTLIIRRPRVFFFPVTWTVAVRSSCKHPFRPSNLASRTHLFTGLLILPQARYLIWPQHINIWHFARSCSTAAFRPRLQFRSSTASHWLLSLINKMKNDSRFSLLLVLVADGSECRLRDGYAAYTVGVPSEWKRLYVHMWPEG